MKRLLLILCFLSLTLASQAQYIYPHGGTLMRDDNEVLSQEEVQELFPEWEHANALRKTGLGLTIGGGVATAVGASAICIGVVTSATGAILGATVGAVVGGENGAQQGGSSGAQAGVPLINAGLITGAVGLVTMAVGIPMLAVNSHRMKKMVGDYNASIAPSANGVGVCFNF